MRVRLSSLTAVLVAAALVASGAPAASAAGAHAAAPVRVAAADAAAADAAVAVGAAWTLPSGTSVAGSDVMPFQLWGLEPTDVVQVWGTFAGQRSLIAQETGFGETAAPELRLFAPLGGKHTFELLVLRRGATVAKASVAYTIIDDSPVVALWEQPASQRVTIGGTARFSVGADDETATYRWQYRKAGSATWVAPSAGNGAREFVLRSLDASFDRAQVRVVVSARGRSVTSRVATITVVANKPRITKQPAASVKAAAGTKVKLSVAATVAGGQRVSYQWQRKAAGTKAWKNLSGRTSTTLAIKVGAKSGGDRYRVVVRSAGQTVTSRESRVIVAAAKTTLKISRVSLRAGKTPVVTVKASQAGTVKVRIQQNAPIWSVTATVDSMDSKVITYTATKTVKVKKGQTVRVPLKKLHTSRTKFTVTATFTPSSKAFAPASAKKVLKSAK